jgi:hypothetical protein
MKAISPKLSLALVARLFLSESGFTGFEDSQDFFHLLPSKHFLLLYLAQPFAILGFFMLLIKELMAFFSSNLH